MGHHRLPQLASAKAHEDARLEWEAFFAISVRRLGLRSSWIDWMHTTYAGYIPEDDSFTILSKRCSMRPIGFQFELHLPEDGFTVIDSYWRVFGEGFLEQPIQHFVITAAATSEGISQGRELLLQWLLTHDKTA